MNEEQRRAAGTQRRRDSLSNSFASLRLGVSAICASTTDPWDDTATDTVSDTINVPVNVPIDCLLYTSDAADE